ncbi:unnamed protein product [Mesocestoides corti]|nr:unnamed protein product [Mesocestoides corti]
MGSAGFNVYMKMVMESSKLQESNIIFIVSGISLLWILPLWIFYDLPSMLVVDKAVMISQLKQASYLLVIDGFARCCQNLVALIMLGRLSVLGYSVAGVIKRLLVIVTAIIFFSTPATPKTYFGLGLATAGLLLYNQVRNEDSQKTRDELITKTLDERDVEKQTLVDSTPELPVSLKNIV